MIDLNAKKQYIKDHVDRLRRNNLGERKGLTNTYDLQQMQNRLGRVWKLMMNNGRGVFVASNYGPGMTCEHLATFVATGDKTASANSLVLATSLVTLWVLAGSYRRLYVPLFNSIPATLGSERASWSSAECRPMVLTPAGCPCVTITAGDKCVIGLNEDDSTDEACGSDEQNYLPFQIDLRKLQGFGLAGRALRKQWHGGKRRYAPCSQATPGATSATTVSPGLHNETEAVNQAMERYRQDLQTEKARPAGRHDS